MNIKYICIALSLACSSFVFTGCSEDDLNSTSVFPKENTEGAAKSAFDNWLDKNYLQPYNITFNYRYNDKLTNRGYDVIPADYEKSIALAKLVKQVWLDVYTEAMGPEFLKTYAPRIMQLIGSYEFNADGSQVLGTAEGGLQIMLFGVNALDIDNPRINKDDPYESHDVLPADLNYWFFHTMHHEFCHILTQQKSYPLEFQQISAGTYHSQDWVNVKDKDAAKQGFVTGYGSGEYNEDFAEIYSTYITLSADGWNAILAELVLKELPLSTRSWI
ncbi:zinc-binding metallopeptidase [Prevotella dentasini]|uniref:zinc-binding metallopeptidase n=1 Tax=Prevotella dentasini TaxID=589537 RepID=UPI00278C0F59|nr:putative zinc-binding metallopeptidase [Prevotella dentasini]